MDLEGLWIQKCLRSAGGGSCSQAPSLQSPRPPVPEASMLRPERKRTPLSAHMGPGDKMGWLYFSVKCQRRFLVSSVTAADSRVLLLPARCCFGSSPCFSSSILEADAPPVSTSLRRRPWTNPGTGSVSFWAESPTRHL